MFVFLFCGSRQNLASIYIAGTGFLKVNDSFFIYTNDTLCKTLFITFFQVLNNNPVLKGGKKFTCIYSLTPNPLMLYGQKMEFPTPSTNPTSKLLFLPLNFSEGLPRLTLASKSEVHKVLALIPLYTPSPAPVYIFSGVSAQSMQWVAQAFT